MTQASLLLDLVNDCIHFVTGFFEIIDESTPHIYHSALPLSPKTSIVWRLYKSYARPLTRIVSGLPTLWEQSIATTKFPNRVNVAAWSPCSRLVAVSYGSPGSIVEIWDAIRFGQPTTLELPLGKLGGTQQLIFSPDGRLLTWFGRNPGKFISWDIQTGVLVSAIPSGQQGDFIYCPSITYSACGTMFGASFRGENLFTIHTYHVLSGTHIHSHSIEGHTLSKIWTCGKFFQTGTVDPGSVTIWEAEFASMGKPKEVVSLHMPDDIYSSQGALFHPTTSRLAVCTEKSISIWSPRDSKFLLDYTDLIDCDDMWMSFSADGHFFACGIIVPETTGPEIYLWKDSPTGYVLHQKLLPNTSAYKPLLSPNGEFIIGFGTTAIQLWHTADSTPTDSPRVSQRTFVLGFSPDGTSAAVTRMGEKVVKVLGLKSGILQLVINVGIKVYGLRMGENTIVIVGKGRIVTWNLPKGPCIPNLQVNISDSVQTTAFDHPWVSTVTMRPTVSISPNLCHVAIVESRKGKDDSILHLYDVSTGRCLVSVLTSCGGASWFTPWFTLDGGEIWCVTDSNTAYGWKIVKGGRSGITKLEGIESVAHPPDGFPWNPSDGYEVMFDRWIFHPSGERLLWLPSHWQLFEWQRMWDGQFLALLHDGLPEALILEL